MSNDQAKKVYKFSKLSLERLATCHQDLQRLMHAVMADQIMDFSILCGFRDKQDQNDAVKRGTSELCWPHGRHNHKPSLAVDIAAYPINNFDDDNTFRTKELAKFVKLKAKELKIPVFWGGDWTHFKDIYHFQLPDIQLPDHKEQLKTMQVVRPDGSVSLMTSY